MTVRRDVPWDFAEQAAVLSNAQLMAHYGAGQHTVTRWRAEIGAPVATTGSFDKLPMPDDWHAVAPGKSQRELRRIYGRHANVIRRWVTESGVVTNGRPNPDAERPRPADFVERWQEMSQVELLVHYKCDKQALQRWIAEMGLTRPPRVRQAARSKKRAGTGMALSSHNVASVDRLRRDGSRAGQAADYLRRFGPVVRCDAIGRYKADGKHWRRGSTVLTADEVIERAVRNGWAPDAWMQVAA